MRQLGIKVMLNYLSGNDDTVNAINASVNKQIQKVYLENDSLIFKLVDGTVLELFDDGQSCCEHRYMTTDDILDEYSGAVLLDFELKDGGGFSSSEYYDHEIQFLDVKTDKGVFQMASHNEHNGYYGGFSIVARLKK